MYPQYIRSQKVVRNNVCLYLPLDKADAKATQPNLLKFSQDLYLARIDATKFF